MKKPHFDSQLKADAEGNRFTVDGDYIMFDKQSNLSYKILPDYTLGDLLTANPMGITRLHKSLLLSLDEISAAFDAPIIVRASYRSPEYNLLTFGQSDSELYTTGNALALGVPPNDVQRLCEIVKEKFTGEIGVYSWGVHIGRAKELKEWDYRADVSFKRKVIDVILNDKMKNVLILAVVGVAGFLGYKALKK